MERRQGCSESPSVVSSGLLSTQPPLSWALPTFCGQETCLGPSHPWASFHPVMPTLSSSVLGTATTVLSQSGHGPSPQGPRPPT